jgi:hypothetical protein
MTLVSQWADENRVLPQSSPEPGEYRTSRTPYMREIMDCLAPSSLTREVDFMKGTQVGAPLDVETPIPTPTGWTRMGDLKVGDKVFDENGMSPVSLPTELGGRSGTAGTAGTRAVTGGNRI